MVIRVKLFAILREKAGRAELDLDLVDGATVGDASQAIGRQIPIVADYLARAAFAVNQEYVKRETGLRDGDELAVIPPVSGG